jgi:PAS domain S-box-containing protein
LESQTSISELQEEITRLKARLAELELSESQDIDNLKKHKTSGELYRLLVENIKDYAIFMLDPNGVVQSWNAGAQSIKGYKAEEIIGRHFSIFYPPEDMAWNKPAWELEQANQAGRFEDEGWRLKQDGTRFWANVIITALRDEQGELKGYAKITRDMTERKQAAEAIRKANAELEKRVVERTFQLIFLADASKVLASSLNYETTLQRVAQLAVPDLADWCTVYILEEGRIPKQVALAHADPAKVKWALDLQQELQSKYPYEPDAPAGLPQVLKNAQPELYPVITDELLVNSAKDEEQLRLLRELGIVSLLIVPMVAREKILGAIQMVSTESGRRYNEDDLAFAQDLAQRAAIAVDNARLYQDAQQAITLRNEFLSVAAHELKTPITSLRGFAQLLVRKLNSPNQPDHEQLLRALGHIDTQSMRLSTLVTRLLDVSQLEAGKLILNRETTNLAQLLRNNVALSQDRTESHSVLIEAPDQLDCYIDPLRFEQVMTNLVDNAIKYSPEGGLIKIELVYLPDSQQAQIKVQDQGIGIPHQNRERIFEPFYQGHQRGYAGLGLGLYICRQIIELHGGQISVEFGEVKGTTFVVKLPINYTASKKTS